MLFNDEARRTCRLISEKRLLSGRRTGQSAGYSQVPSCHVDALRRVEMGPMWLWRNGSLAMPWSWSRYSRLPRYASANLGAHVVQYSWVDSPARSSVMMMWRHERDSSGHTAVVPAHSGGLTMTICFRSTELWRNGSIDIDSAAGSKDRDMGVTIAHPLMAVRTDWYS